MLWVNCWVNFNAQGLPCTHICGGHVGRHNLPPRRNKPTNSVEKTTISSIIDYSRIYTNTLYGLAPELLL